MAADPVDAALQRADFRVKFPSARIRAVHLPCQAMKIMLDDMLDHRAGQWQLAKDQGDFSMVERHASKVCFFA